MTQKVRVTGHSTDKHSCCSGGAIEPLCSVCPYNDESTMKVPGMDKKVKIDIKHDIKDGFMDVSPSSKISKGYTKRNILKEAIIYAVILGSVVLLLGLTVATVLLKDF